MTNRTRDKLLRMLVGPAAWLCGAPAARACAVCGGAKDSLLVKGAENGVLLMLGVTYFVLLGMAALAVTWFVRVRRRQMGPAGSPDEQPAGRLPDTPPA